MGRFRRGPAVLAVLLLGVAGVLGLSSDSPAPAPAEGGTLAAAPASGTTGVAVVKKSPDPGAPATAPAHWLPPEPWVYNHWLPYDEARLYTLLKLTRQELWVQLRDDRRTLAQLAAARGWREPAALARALVAPRRQAVGAARTAQLQQRALATITEGHLAQHVFFHSLHQFAIPSAAPDIFGVTDADFRRLRRDELSPLAIGRLHGRSPGSVQGAAIAVLRERVRAGVRGGAISATQGALLLRRQLTQLPRWLDQARYNGPPLTYRGNLESKPRDYASNPAISADGRFVAYEGYRQKLPLAVKLGEIAVLRANLRTGATALVSGLNLAHSPRPTGANPISAYNPSISGDGRLVTYESSAGNQNFAKRYGRIGTVLSDVRRRATTPVGRPVRDVPESQSSYNPDVAAGGSRVVYQAVRDGRTVILARDVRSGRERTVFAGRRAGARRYADPYEASTSRNGRRVVFTVASGAVGDGRSARSTVLVRDLRSGWQIVASRANGRRGAVADAFSADPAISPDGGFVAFTSSDPVLGPDGGDGGLYLRDLRRGRTVRIPTAAGRVLDPVVSTGGAVVAFTAVRGAQARVMVWRASTGAVQIASRASGTAGAAGDGWSGDPSLSADGRRVAFASTATSLTARRSDGARAIFVRDLATRRTDRVSEVVRAYAGRTVPAKPAAAPPPAPAPGVAPAAPVADSDATRTVFITDNAFLAGGQRPVVRVAAGDAVRWLWRARQSHSVLVRSGPERFGSAVRNHGSFQYRFTKPGVYAIVCALHAPGMKATVIVRGS